MNKKDPIPCLHCGEPVLDSRGHRDKSRLFCTVHVHLSKRPKRTKAQIRARLNEGWQRYQCRKRAQTPDNVDINKLQEIYRNCPPGHEVDHIIPISKGGLHTPENLQYLTISQNRSKGAKLDWQAI